jgi:AraC-like DNA-binding protein
MEKSKSYLKSNLTLTDLAEELQLNPKHLSQVLNEGFNENFYKFVNRYRVEEAKQLLHNSFEKFSITGIAYEAGFNSKSTFNKAFKEYTGYSPSEYVKRITRS